jgi:hypothetical protein
MPARFNVHLALALGALIMTLDTDAQTLLSFPLRSISNGITASPPNPNHAFASSCRNGQRTTREPWSSQPRLRVRRPAPSIR